MKLSIRNTVIGIGSMLAVSGIVAAASNTATPSPGPSPTIAVSATAPPNIPVATDAPTASPVATPTPVPTTVPHTPAPATPQASSCDPNYSGCVPIASDVDCAGGSGNGPAYVKGPIRVIGKDIYGLDRDGNGIACE